jgi:hypothetical protein
MTHSYLLPASVLLLGLGMAIPGLLFAGMVLAATWAALSLLDLLAGDAAANILTAGCIGAALAAWPIL